MAFIVINLLPINPTSLQCGQRLGVAGNYFYITYSHTLELRKWTYIICFLSNTKVFRIRRPTSQKTCSGFGICSSPIHTKRRILCKLLHGWFSYTDLTIENLVTVMAVTRVTYLVHAVSWRNQFWSHSWRPFYHYQLWLWCSTRWIWWELIALQTLMHELINNLKSNHLPHFTRLK